MKSWRQLEPAPYIPEPNTSVAIKTGDWRTRKPVWDEAKCTHCLFCWFYCPDTSILVKEDKMVGIDYDHCKGCGICADVCPPKSNAIEMIQEVK